MMKRATTAMMVMVAGGALALGVVGCEKKEATPPVPTTSGSAANPADTPRFMLLSRPDNVVDVAAAKGSAKVGDSIALRGKIGGRPSPMSEGVATFVMMDPAIPSCADNAEDGCPTPWDYCCETPESIMNNSATVQVVGADGTALKTDLKKAGLAPLDEVIVVGTVAEKSAEGVLVVKATGVFKAGA